MYWNRQLLEEVVCFRDQLESLALRQTFAIIAAVSLYLIFKLNTLAHLILAGVPHFCQRIEWKINWLRPLGR